MILMRMILTKFYNPIMDCRPEERSDEGSREYFKLTCSHRHFSDDAVSGGNSPGTVARTRWQGQRLSLADAGSKRQSAKASAASSRKLEAYKEPREGTMPSSADLNKGFILAGQSNI